MMPSLVPPADLALDLALCGGARQADVGQGRWKHVVEQRRARGRAGNPGSGQGACETSSPNGGAGVLPKLVAPGPAYERFVARFPYFTTVDQAKAIRDVLDDLAAGHPMDRVVCGDVGFGKTEVALRAAAAVALSGKQVAVAVPTTVLARQHVETFRKRFAPFGIEVAKLVAGGVGSGDKARRRKNCVAAN